MSDTELMTFLITWAAAASTFSLALLRQRDFRLGRPLLSVGGIVASEEALDICVKNAGSGIALNIVFKIQGAFNGDRSFSLDALGGGGEIDLKSVCPRSEWVQMTFDYTDLGGKHFYGSRRLEVRGNEQYRLIEATDSGVGKRRLLGLLPPK